MPETDPKPSSVIPDVDRLKKEIQAKAAELKILRRLLKVAEDAGKLRSQVREPAENPAR